MPQFSLNDYLVALKSVWLRDPALLESEGWLVPVRSFNPASLTTLLGRSVIGQLLKASRAIVVEDTDLTPEHLASHMRGFGISGAVAQQFVNDGFSTEAFHYVITTPDVADRLPGRRIC